MSNNYVGLDGCRAGWIAAVISEKHGQIQLFSTIEDACMHNQRCERVLIDIPIGLAANKQEAVMRPEPAARKVLGKRASCIFNAPCKQAVYAKDYSEANEINKRVLHKGISKQSYYISNKIREADIFLHSFPEYKGRLLESHPEVCFAMLNKDRQPIMESKKTIKGFNRRIQLLASYYPRTVEILEEVKQNQQLSAYLEDVIDALVLAVSNYLTGNNEFSSFPVKPALNQDGLCMQMVYAHT